MAGRDVHVPLMRPNDSVAARYTYVPSRSGLYRATFRSRDSVDCSSLGLTTIEEAGCTGVRELRVDAGNVSTLA